MPSLLKIPGTSLPQAVEWSSREVKGKVRVSGLMQMASD